ncbi:MAG: serine hydrolase domain-containing protein [Myxococcota bacterium]|nr:serine hydrolase domain-containing protein [Myxococcota bacterium]
MIHRLPLFLLLLLLVSGCPLSGSLSLDDDDDDDATGDDDDDDATEDWKPLPEILAWAFEDEAEDLGAPGVAVAIVHEGQLYAQGFGTRHPEGDEPVLPSTLFRIGSVTKVLTATAILAQADRGTLALDDRLVDFLPSLELVGEGDIRQASLHELLSHQGGSSDYTPITGGSEDERLLDASLAEFPTKAWGMAPPGSFWNYSNPNYSLAGLMLEQSDGRWYREIMTEELFGPLGMDRTCFLAEEVFEDGNYAVGLSYDWTGESNKTVLAEPDSYDDAWARPAGFAWSSVLELSDFARFLLEGRDDVLSDESHEALTSPQVNTELFLDSIHYSYGLLQIDGRTAEQQDWYDIQTLGHSGALPGYSAELITVPEEELIIVTLASASGVYFDRAIATVLEFLLEQEPSSPPNPRVDPEDFHRYTGTYQEPYNVGLLLVSQQDDRLEVAMPELDALGIPYDTQLYPRSLGNFWMVINEYPFAVTFLFNEDEGPTEWLRSRYFVGRRGEERSVREVPPELRRARVQAMLDSRRRAPPMP